MALAPARSFSNLHGLDSDNAYGWPENKNYILLFLCNGICHDYGESMRLHD